jgi:hypothetical protein
MKTVHHPKKQDAMLTQVEVVLHGVVQYFEQLHDVRVMKLLEDCDLAVHPLQGIHYRLVSVGRHAA